MGKKFLVIFFHITNNVEVASKHVTFIVSNRVEWLVKFAWKLIMVGVQKKEKVFQDFCAITFYK